MKSVGKDGDVRQGDVAGTAPLGWRGGRRSGMSGPGLHGRPLTAWTVRANTVHAAQGRSSAVRRGLADPSPRKDGSGELAVAHGGDQVGQRHELGVVRDHDRGHHELIGHTAE